MVVDAVLVLCRLLVRLMMPGAVIDGVVVVDAVMVGTEIFGVVMVDAVMVGAGINGVVMVEDFWFRKESILIEYKHTVRSESFLFMCESS